MDFGILNTCSTFKKLLSLIQVLLDFLMLKSMPRFNSAYRKKGFSI